MDGTIEKLLDGLISVISDEAKVFEKFLELLETQQEALITNNTEALQTVTAQLQKVVGQSQYLERERARVVEELRPHGHSEDDLNVAKICEMADAARSMQLRNLRETILNLYTQIEETRMRNGLLVEQSMEQIQFTIETIGRIPTESKTYQKQGSLSRETVSLGLDRRV